MSSFHEKCKILGQSTYIVTTATIGFLYWAYRWLHVAQLGLGSVTSDHPQLQDDELNLITSNGLYIWTVVIVQEIHETIVAGLYWNNLFLLDKFYS